MTETEFPTLTTGRFLLRQIAESDLPFIFKGLSDPDVIRYYGVSYTTLEATRAQLQFYKDLEKSGAGTYWAICSADNRVFYGVGGLNGVSRKHKKAETGFWLFKEFWGQGIMSATLPVICQYGFNTLELHRIEGFVETGNRNCKNALKKLGFTYEGTMRDCEIKNGEFISLDIFSKLRTG